MATNGNDDDVPPLGGGDLPVLDLQTMEELLSGDDANKHLDRFLHVTQSIKVNGVTDDSLRLYLFSHSLTHHATAWFDRLPRNSITTFEQMAKKFLEKYFPPSMVTKLRNEITNFRQRLDESLFEACEHYKLSIARCPNYNMLPVTQMDTFYNGLTFKTLRYNQCCCRWNLYEKASESSSSTTSSFDPKIIALKAEITEINKNLMKILQINQQVKVVTHRCETCGGPHSYNDCPATVGQTQNVYAAGAYIKVMNTASSSGSGTLSSNIITNPNEYLKGITTRSGNAYQGPTIPTTYSPPKVVERETEPVVAPVVVPVEAPVSALKPNPKPSIPYPSRPHDQKLRDKANDQKEKFFQIFQDLNFNISFADALIPMPKFGSTIKTLLTNKEKLFVLARTPLNEHCSANKFSLPELSPTCMTLELAKRLISRPVRVAEDVFVKVGTFHFPADFVVIDFDADPRVPLSLGRTFIKTGRALIDIYEGELTLRVGYKSITFNLDQTSRYSANYDAMSVNRIDLIDVACEEYSQEVLGFSVSGNPTPSTEPILSTSSPTLTSFGDNDFLLEETDAFLAINDEPILLEIDDSYYDSKGDILLLKEFINDDP
uniref:Reverse transcriptase domain-containing protein n=1 Tax=Tanacetum cinerariifolium TaxID=118510 RepID=A0A699HET0_TANCI|nr:reverse transcriptase domain-containing protein [Tanacetum cinerariifolium]